MGEIPPLAVTAEVTLPHVRRAVDEGMEPTAVADLVADAIAGDRFWVLTDPGFTAIALHRWQGIANGENPALDVDMPGLAPRAQMVSEVQQLLAGPGAGS
jgi:hypothetical protein